MAKTPRSRAFAKPGATLRALRARHGWTLAEVSRRTGLAIPTLSKLENDKMSLSYDKMMQIATGLGVDIGVLFARPAAAAATGARDAGPDAAVVPPAGRRSITRKGEGRIIEQRNFTQRYPAADLLRKQLVPIITDVKARSREAYGPLLRHAGEEYVLVLEGVLELHTEFYAPARLEAGDSIYFDSSMAHGYVAAAPGPCRMLSVCSTADWGGTAEETATDLERAMRVLKPRVARAG